MTGTIPYTWVFIIWFTLGGLVIYAQEESIPEPVAMIEFDSAAITNVLLIGSATENGSSNPGLTDTLMLVSINHDHGHIGAVSIPRDLYVYVPGYGMNKINQAYFLAETHDDNGIAVLHEVFRYNFGIDFEYYVRVDFSGFGALVDSIGGIDIAIDCAIEDWRLIEEDLDKHDPDNWELVTMWAGLYHMDGDTALWYVRSRRTSTDLDRGRRQQDVLRAIWRRIRSEGLLENFPALWEQFHQIAETDLTFLDAVRFLPLLRELDAAAVDYHTMRLGQELDRGYTPDEGRFVFYPRTAELQSLFNNLFATDQSRSLGQILPTVGIYNASGTRGLAYVAAHRIEREGFRAIIIEQETRPRDYNHIVDRMGVEKNSPLTRLQRALRTSDEGISIEPDPQRTYDYEVYIGSQYQLMSCTYPVAAPSNTE